MKLYLPPPQTNQRTKPQTNQQKLQTKRDHGTANSSVFPSSGDRSSSEEWIHSCTVSRWNEKLGVLISTPALRVFLAELQPLIWAAWTPGSYEHLHLWSELLSTVIFPFLFSAAMYLLSRFASSSSSRWSKRPFITKNCSGTIQWFVAGWENRGIWC